jgi:hypothetical protein
MIAFARRRVRLSSGDPWGVKHLQSQETRVLLPARKRLRHQFSSPTKE